MKTAALQHRNAYAPIVIAALVMALGGCASAGKHAPKTEYAPTTEPEASSNTGGNHLGVVVGAAGGAVVGALYSIQCGPLFFLCAPPMAAVGAVMGAVKGSESGPRAGYNRSRTRAAPASTAQASEPAAPPPIEPSALADALAEATSKGELAPGPLGVLIIGMSHGAILRPAFVEVDNIESAAGTVTRLVQSNFITSVPAGPQEKPQQKSAIIWVCMIAHDGNRVELQFEGDGTVRRRYQERVDPVFRSEVKAVMGDRAAYNGGYVCGLQVATDWPADVKSKIVAFVDGMAAP